MVLVSGDDDVIGKPDGETGGDDGVGCMGKVISICPYVPLVLNPQMPRFHQCPHPPGVHVLVVIQCYQFRNPVFKNSFEGGLTPNTVETES